MKTAVPCNESGMSGLLREPYPEGVEDMDTRQKYRRALDAVTAVVVVAGLGLQNSWLIALGGVLLLGSVRLQERDK